MKKVLRQIVPLSLRSDPMGDGSWHASRDSGTRKHKGVDLACYPHCTVICPVAGEVTKLGYVYSDDLRWRYVQVTDRGGLRHRFFYVDPMVNVGEILEPDMIMGIAQDITERYPGRGMLPHIHYEVMDRTGARIKPEVNLG